MIPRGPMGRVTALRAQMGPVLFLVCMLACGSSSSDASTPGTIEVGGGILCTEVPRYALCTSAPCEFAPGDTNILVCDCVVMSGPNWGKSSCAARVTDGNGVRSEFSPVQGGPPLNLRALSCAEASPWADCLDSLCTVDPDDAKKASCQCSVSTEAPWVTLGGGCDTARCDELWSGEASSDPLSPAMLEAFKELGVSSHPIQSCSE